MDTITGFTFLVISISLQINSEVNALPPGLLILNTTALIFLSSLASCKERLIDNSPTTSKSPSPEPISPCA